MLRLYRSLKAWGGADFESVFKRELEDIGVRGLPLQQGLSRSNAVSDSPCQVMVIGVKENNKAITIKAGVFYQGIIAGCSCADDPTPIDEQAEYCELELSIDKVTAETRVDLLET